MAEVEKIPQHRHCINCNKAFVGVGNYCNDTCRDSSGKEVKKKLRNYFIILAILVGFTLFILIKGI